MVIENDSYSIWVCSGNLVLESGFLPTLTPFPFSLSKHAEFYTPSFYWTISFPMNRIFSVWKLWYGRMKGSRSILVFYITITLWWARWRLKSPDSRLFTQSFTQGADQTKHWSSASLAFVKGIHRWPVNSPHKGPVTRKCFHITSSSWNTRQVVEINSNCQIRITYYVLHIFLCLTILWYFISFNLFSYLK